MIFLNSHLKILKTVYLEFCYNLLTGHRMLYAARRRELEKTTSL